MDTKTLDQIKVYLAEATNQLLTLDRLIDSLEDELKKETPAE